MKCFANITKENGLTKFGTYNNKPEFENKFKLRYKILIYGSGFNPSHFTFQFPLLGKPTFVVVLPSHPAHIIATDINKPPLPGR